MCLSDKKLIKFPNEFVSVKSDLNGTIEKFLDHSSMLLVFLATEVTFTPSLANIKDIAAPKPLLAPRTSAVFPFNL